MRKLLIAIDSEIFTEELKRALRSEFEIYTCSGGDDALQALGNIKPSALIIDFSLPVINGLEVLKQTSYTPPVIIALTNFISDHIVQEAQAAGVKALIRHPCTLNSIISCLDRIQ